MIIMDPLSILANPITWIIVGALQEIIAFSPLKENSIVQLIFRALASVRPDGKKAKKQERV